MELKNKPLVSIIIPTYNRAELISETIQSILNQSYNNFELLIISDASTDKSDEVIMSFEDDRIIFIKMNKNSGRPAVPRNIGIDRAKGEYIAFCDDDDLWETNKLEIQIGEMIEHDLDMTFTDIYIFYNDPTILKKQYKRRLALLFNLKIKKLLLFHNLISNATVVLRKSLVNKVGLLNEDPRLRAVEDYEYWIRCIYSTNKFKFINKRLIKYRIHNHRISSNDEGKSKKNLILETLRKTNVISDLDYKLARKR